MTKVFGIILIAGLCHLLQVEGRNVGRERFEFEPAPSIATVQQEYQSLVRHLEILRGGENTDCQSDVWQKLANSKQKTPCWFFSHFAPAVGVMMDGLQQPSFSWIPAARLSDAELLVKQWKEWTAKGVTYACINAICRISVTALNSAPAESVFLECSILVFQGQPSGAPWDCMPYAILAGNSTWVRVIVGYNEDETRTLGLPDFDLILIGKRFPALSNILGNLDQALQDRPLSLATIDDRITHRPGVLFGTSQYVPSQILADYRPRLREIATVRVEVRLEKKNDISRLTISAATNLLVSTLASTDPADWHLPSPAQENRYVAALKASLKKTLELSCDHSAWRSARVLTCGMPADTPLPDWTTPD